MSPLAVSRLRCSRLQATARTRRDDLVISRCLGSHAAALWTPTPHSHAFRGSDSHPSQILISLVSSLHVVRRAPCRRSAYHIYAANPRWVCRQVHARPSAPLERRAHALSLARFSTVPSLTPAARGCTASNPRCAGSQPARSTPNQCAGAAPSPAPPPAPVPPPAPPPAARTVHQQPGRLLPAPSPQPRARAVRPPLMRSWHGGGGGGGAGARGCGASRGRGGPSRARPSSAP